jgi:hypothetical protein
LKIDHVFSSLGVPIMAVGNFILKRGWGHVGGLPVPRLADITLSMHFVL